MQLPDQICEAINQAYANMLQQPQHALIPMYRHQLYDIMLQNDESLNPSIYLRINIVTAEYVLPVWSKELPESNIPSFLLTTGKKVLAGQIDLPAAQLIAEDSMEKLDQFSRIQIAAPTTSAYYAGQAAFETFLAVLGKPPFDGVSIQQDFTDADLDPWSSDTAKWGATAYAGGVWDLSSDTEKRKEFWSWWLHEAIPAVWYGKI